ncbi:PRELI domain-containing protein 1, mitochondrial-like [Uloborus diversus]|uniref:PRELI domain-containing protein 1, mitochondrial-like n=1 Tax=Uloborus diversus TaxID=327109 RepID=UPI00240919CB|nr:PRELI domain-containing protein 1, mitochondrial-like [Uloborus diversus]XP_054723770.1 PRELI domain-containing protein 1, mitochondrial-like [Uloborus diversus]
MKFFEGENIFQYSWFQVAQAFWFRYPNPFSKHVQTEDVLYRKVESGILHTKRLLTKSVRVSYFGYNIAIKNEPILEESFIDPENRIIKTCTWNIGTAVARVKEECYYKPKEEKQTVIERKAWIASSKYYFPGIIERYMIRRFQKNVQKTCKGLEYVLTNMYPPPMTESKSSFLDKDKLCEKARKAKNIATSGAVPIFAAYADKQS